MLKAMFIAIAGLLMASGVQAAEVNEASCRNPNNGMRIYTPECNAWFAANQPFGSDIACANDSACIATRQARGLAEADARERRQREQSAAAAREEAAQQARCKDDLNNPRIGMPLARALDCTEGLGLIAEERTASGVVRTYGDGTNFLRVSAGKVVAVGRY